MTAAVRQYANDGSLESVDAMLIKMASTFYPRVMAMGLPMEFDDVVQELRLAYVKAREKWKPEQARFTTYCYTVARNEFNRRIERMCLDREKLGLSSIDALATNSADEDAGDGYERYEADEAVDGPDSGLEFRETLKSNLARLSPASRALIRELVANETQSNRQLMTMYQIAAKLGMSSAAISLSRAEFNAVFGVDVDFMQQRRVAPK